MEQPSPSGSTDGELTAPLTPGGVTPGGAVGSGPGKRKPPKVSEKKSNYHFYIKICFQKIFKSFFFIEEKKYYSYFKLEEWRYYLYLEYFRTKNMFPRGYICPY